MSEAGERLIIAGKELSETIGRRFGPGFLKPCNNPRMIECAQWECQRANECQFVVADKPSASEPKARKAE